MEVKIFSPLNHTGSLSKVGGGEQPLLGGDF